MAFEDWSLKPLLFRLWSVVKTDMSQFGTDCLVGKHLLEDISFFAYEKVMDKMTRAVKYKITRGQIFHNSNVDSLPTKKKNLLTVIELK